MLIRYEWKKLWSHRFLWFATAALLVLDVLYVALPPLTDEDYPPETELHAQVDGAITAETMAFLRAGMEHPTSEGYFNDTRLNADLFSSVYADMQSAWDYAEQAAAWCAQAADNVNFFTARGNTCFARQNQQILDHYSDRRLTVYTDTRGACAWFAHGGSSLCVVLLLLLGLSPLVCEERERGTVELLCTSVYGRRRTTAAKLAVACGYAVVVTWLFAAADTVAVAVGYGLRGLAMPLYSLPDYRQTALTATVWQGMVLVTTLRALGAVVVGLLFTLCSAWSRRPRGAFAACFVLTALCVAAGEWAGNPLSLFTPQQWMQTNEIVRVGDQPLPAVAAAAAAGAILAALAAMALLLSDRRRTHG